MENGKRNGIASTIVRKLLSPKYMALGAIGAAIIFLLWGVWLFYPRVTTGDCTGRGMDFQVLQLNGNWSVRIDEVYHWVCTDGSERVPSSPLSETKITVRSANGTIKQPMDHVTLSNLTAGNWEIYKGYYQRKASESELAVGAFIVLDQDAYPLGSYFEIVTRQGFVGRCTLR